MRFVNPNLYISLAFCLILFISGRQLAELPCDGGTRKKVIALLAIIALPSLLFPLGYMNVFRESPVYCSFRTINRIEIMTSLLSPLFGYITYRRKEGLFIDFGRLSRVKRGLRPFAFPFCVLFILSCYMSPIILPLNRESGFSSNWENGVLMQSAQSTCGPAALATAMYRSDGRKDSEEDISRETYASGVGTDSWYLARYATERGFSVTHSVVPDITGAVVPAIACVRVIGTAHYVAILSIRRGIVEVGDPLRGKLSLTPEEFNILYEFSGCIITVSL
ncbi:MAG: cysteine peptidase family C39 domain-containing protein [Oscillospiraceae bacterium]|nr:cysteine peptidase family C39 domain-containing protein [Oscillospiraceae bacterium]